MGNRQERRARQKLERRVQKKLRLAANRKCGPCTVCCTVLAVDELQKKRHVQCEHVNENGCGIYETKPHSCNKFKCAWLEGAPMFGPQMRPDLCGVVAWPELTAAGYTLLLDEVEPGAFDKPEIRKLLDACNVHVPLVLMGYGNTRKLRLKPGQDWQEVLHNAGVYGGADGRTEGVE